MFRSLPKYLFLFLAYPVLAQDTPKSLLWKVTGPGVARPSYLFGTAHSRDERAFRFSDSVWIAMGRADVVAGELDLEKGRQNAMAMMNIMLLPDGKKLQDLYAEKEWQRIDAHLKEDLGAMAAMVQRMKPFFVMAMLTEAQMGTDREKVLDDHILSTARAQGQRVIGIETFEEQVRAMDALPLVEQAQMLLEYVDSEGDAAEDLNALIDAYEAQDLDAMMEITENSGQLPKGMEKALLTERNHRMAHRLDSIMRGGENVFFAVGAAHLPRKDGLITLLRDKGYTVEPVMYTVVRREETEPAEEKVD